MNPVRWPSFSSQNPNRRPGEDSPSEIAPSHPLGFLLPQATNPNAAPPVLYSFFPLSPNDMEPTAPASPTPDTAPTPSCPPTFAPSQTVNPRSFHLFLPPSYTVNESQLPNDHTIHSRPLQPQEASPASRPADSPLVLRRQHITTDSEITHQGLEALTRLIKEAYWAEAAQISHPRLQICNPPAQIAQQNPKSDPDIRNIKKSVPSMVRKAASSKTTACDLFFVANALGGNKLLDLVWAAYASYVSKDETEGRREPSDQTEVDQN